MRSRILNDIKFYAVSIVILILVAWVIIPMILLMMAEVKLTKFQHEYEEDKKNEKEI